MLSLIEVNIKKKLKLCTTVEFNTTKQKLSIQIVNDYFGVLLSMKIKSGNKYLISLSL